MEFQELVAAYGDALAEAGHASRLRVPKRVTGRRANSRDSFEVFAEIGEAPEVLATVARYSEFAGLQNIDDFSISCFPSTEWSRESMRACTISVGVAEVAYVVLDRPSGELTQFVAYGEPDEDLFWLGDSQFWAAYESDIDGGGTRLALSGRHAVEMLDNPLGKEFVARRLRGIRKRKRRARRNDWHNPWLWEFVVSGITASSRSSAQTVCGDWDVTSDDVLRLTQQRTSQQAFRQHLLDSGERECAICGLDVEEVLEAAHLLPHADGGRASNDNGCILCANHHWAFDAGLYKWTGCHFVWVGNGEEPVFGKKTR